MIFTVNMGGADSLLCFYGGTSLYNLGVFSSSPWAYDDNYNSGNYYNTYQPLGLGYVVSGTNLETIPAYFSIKNKTHFGAASINPGTVSTSGSAVTGVGTQFTKSFQVGDSIHIPITGHVSKTILTITDDAHLTTNGSAWATQTGVNYYGSRQLYFAAGGLTGRIATGDQVGIEGGTYANNGVTPYFVVASVVSDTVLRLTTATPSTLYNTSVAVDFVNGVNPDALQVVPSATQPAQHGLNTIGLPTAQLDIGPSTGAPGSASIKIEPGTVLATPEDGTLEYDGTHLYFTIGATRHTIV
jgi:hypothetical protein